MRGGVAVRYVLSNVWLEIKMCIEVDIYVRIWITNINPKQQSSSVENPGAGRPDLNIRVPVFQLRHPWLKYFPKCIGAFSIKNSRCTSIKNLCKKKSYCICQAFIAM